MRLWRSKSLCVMVNLCRTLYLHYSLCCHLFWFWVHCCHYRWYCLHQLSCTQSFCVHVGVFVCTVVSLFFYHHSPLDGAKWLQQVCSARLFSFYAPALIEHLLSVAVHCCAKQCLLLSYQLTVYSTPFWSFIMSPLLLGRVSLVGWLSLAILSVAFCSAYKVVGCLTKERVSSFKSGYCCSFY